MFLFAFRYIDKMIETIIEQTNAIQILNNKTLYVGMIGSLLTEIK